jgi:hypothetical protein
MLSFRDVEELLAARFIVVTYQTVRQWCLKFGQHFANGIRRRRGRLGDTWHLDEVFVIGTTSKATASKPLTVSRVFAVHKSETGSHDARSVLSAYRLETTYVRVAVAIVVLSMRKAARGFYRTRMHATLKRSDELLPGAQWLERLCRHIPDCSGHLVRDDGCYSS